MYNFHLRGQYLPLEVFDDLAVELHGLLGPHIGRGDPDTKSESPRFGDETHLWIVEGEPGGMHRESDPTRLPRCEGEAGKSEQYAVGAGDRGDLVAIVELYHLGSFALSGVAHLDGDLDQLSGTGCLHDDVTVGKRGVAHPMPKGEQRRGRRVNIIAKEHGSLTSRTHSSVVRNLTYRAWHAHG